MNKKGYALSSIIYPLLIACLILTLSILSDINNKKNLLDKIKEDTSYIYNRNIPVITNATNKGSSIVLEYKIDNINLATSYRCYYDKLKNFESAKTLNSNTNSCELSTEVGTSYYYKVCAIDSSGNEHCSKIGKISTFTGIPSGTYEPGTQISYAGTNWKVISDNGDTTTLVLATFYTVGQYGGTSWETSDIKNVLNNDFISRYPILKDDISNLGIVFDETSNSYVRIPKKSEVSTQISNNASLPFWLMDISNSSAAYATGGGRLNYSIYKKGTQVTGYNGYGKTLESISSLHDSISNATYCSNVSTQTNSNLYAPLSSTSVITSQTCKVTADKNNPASALTYNGRSGYTTRTYAVNSTGYLTYFTEFYVGDSYIRKNLCVCNTKTTESDCKSKVEASSSITCDSVMVGDGVNSLTVYYAPIAYYATNNINVIEDYYQPIARRPVITVKER